MSTSRRRALRVAIALATASAGCGGVEEPPPRFCAPDAGVVSTVVEVSEGLECATRRLSIPFREELSCGELPEAFGGGRITLRGHTGTDWSVVIERTDGAPLETCAAVLDATCACVTGRCSTERYFYIDLGNPDAGFVDLVLQPGTYELELCSR